jgi:hypothetical protein
MEEITRVVCDDFECELVELNGEAKHALFRISLHRSVPHRRSSRAAGFRNGRPRRGTARHAGPVSSVGCLAIPRQRHGYRG